MKSKLLLLVSLGLIVFGWTGFFWTIYEDKSIEKETYETGEVQLPVIEMHPQRHPGWRVLVCPGRGRGM